MNNRTTAKALVACVGIVTIGVLTYLLKQPVCLWALFFLLLLVEDVN